MRRSLRQVQAYSWGRIGIVKEVATQHVEGLVTGLVDSQRLEAWREQFINVRWAYGAGGKIEEKICRDFQILESRISNKRPQEPGSAAPRHSPIVLDSESF
jgi:hypothetical protein